MNSICRWRKLSTKSQGMILAGLIWIGIGLGLHNELGLQFPSVFHTHWNEQFRAVLAIAPGLFSITAAVTRKHKGWAIASLGILPCVRAVSFLYSSLMGLIPGLPDGYEPGWYFAMQPLACMLLVWALTKLPSHPVEPSAGHDTRRG